MAQLVMTSNDVYEKKPSHMYDHGYKLVVSYPDNVIRIRHYHDDGELFVFGRLIFAPEIKTIFVLDLYGFNYHSFADQAEFYGADGLESNEHCIRIDEISSIILPAFPELYEHVEYGMDELTAAVNEYRGQLIKQTPALAHILPSLLIHKVLQAETPSWVKASYDTMNLKERFYLDINDYYYVSDLFTDVPDVYIDLYYIPE